MIYVQTNLKGRNIYTKLDDVIEVNTIKDEKEGYEKLGTSVKNNYDQYQQKMEALQHRKMVQGGISNFNYNI